MTEINNNILDELHSEYLNKVLTLNSSIWQTLITLHAIIISIFALLLSSLIKKINLSVIGITVIILFISLLSIWLLFKNFTDYREIYNNLCYHTHPKNRDYEKLKAEHNNAQAKNEIVKGRETFAKRSFYIGFISVFLILFYI